MQHATCNFELTAPESIINDSSCKLISGESFFTFVVIVCPPHKPSNMLITLFVRIIFNISFNYVRMKAEVVSKSRAVQSKCCENSDSFHRKQ